MMLEVIIPQKIPVEIPAAVKIFQMENKKEIINQKKDHPVTGGPFWTGENYEYSENRCNHSGIPSGGGI